MAALADVSNTLTLTSGQHYNFDTGTTSTSGGDINFTGTSITFVGSAQGSTELGASGSAGYSTLTSQILQFLTYSTAAISGSSLVKDEVIGVKTNGGHYAAVLITAVSSSSLSITYTAFGVTGTSNVPTISAVQDAGSYTANIAQGSTFVIKGTGLSASGLTYASFPLPTTFGNVSIFFTPQAGGNVTPAYIVYLYNESGVNQLAAILPSTVATGSYNVTVINNGATSSPFPVQVVKQKPGLITADSSGYGLVVAQNFISTSEYDVNRYTTGSLGGFTISPAHPGETEIAYSVGMGSDQGSGVADNMASPGYNFLTNGVNVQVIVGGMTITPSYAGRVPGGTGYEQINFVLPANVPTGCVVSFQISENGTLSQVTYISIAVGGASVCAQPGYTTAQLQAFESGTTSLSGGFSLIEETITAAGQNLSLSSAGGEFSQYSGFQLAAIPADVQTIITNQGCTVLQISTTTPPTSIPGTATFLDAGKVTLSGPAASNLNNTPLAELLNTYDLSISGAGSTVNGNIVAGTYTLNGAGGTSVGPFTATVTIPTPLTVIGGLPSTVTRSAGLTINWTGGNSSDFVEIIGEAGTYSNGVVTGGASFICITTAGPGFFTVPSSILTQLPAISAAQIANTTGIAGLDVIWGSGSTSGNGLFTAPLVGGGSINNAGFSVSSLTGNEPAYQ